MSLNITLDISIDDPNIPIIDPTRALIRPSSLAIYDCQSSQDLSGRGNNMVLSAANTITPLGITLVNQNGYMTTPLDETDTMTIISCHNLTGEPTDAKQLIGNMAPAGPPYSGIRWSQSSAVSGFVAATDAPGTATLPFTFHGAWTIQAVTIDTMQMQRITHGGGVTPVQLGAARRKSTNKLSINGAPSDSNLTVKNGFNGTLGFMLIYDEIVPTADIINLMNVVTGIMADRGQPVP